MFFAENFHFQWDSNLHRHHINRAKIGFLCDTGALDEKRKEKTIEEKSKKEK
jgi:hypothetical protein